MSSSDLRRRMTSVTTAQKLISALRLVAAARIRAASSSALSARPFAQEVAAVLQALVANIRCRSIFVEHIAPALGPEARLRRIYLAMLRPSGSAPLDEGSTTLLVVITADKGFCGQYNKSVLTKAAARIEKLSLTSSVELVVIGKVATAYFQRMYPDIPVRFSAPVGPTRGAHALGEQLSDVLMNEFVVGGVHRIEVLYTRFMSLMSSCASLRTLIPVEPTGHEGEGDELLNVTITSRNGCISTTSISGGKQEGTDHVGSTFADPRSPPLYNISDDEAVSLLNAMLPMYVRSQLVRIICESIAAEQACRLSAMSSADTNARDVERALKRRYHRERQAHITASIFEVSNYARDRGNGM